MLLPRANVLSEKEQIGKYALSQPSLRSIVVNPAYYMENFNAKEWAVYLGGLPFILDSEGYYTLSWPLWGGSNEVPLIAIERDFGDIVHGVLLNLGLLCGKTIQAVSQSRALEEVPNDFEHGMIHSFCSASVADFYHQQPGKRRVSYPLKTGVYSKPTERGSCRHSRRCLGFATYLVDCIMASLTMLISLRL